VKGAIEKAITQGSSHIVLDLERCPIMDSTFLGTLTGAAVQLRDTTPPGTVSILNANSRNQQLISSLGLNYLLDLDDAPGKWTQFRNQVTTSLEQCAEQQPMSPQEQAAHVLKSHKELVAVSPENQCRFEDVITYLEKELGKS